VTYEEIFFFASTRTFVSIRLLPVEVLSHGF
jgi:hypothetical protein